VATHTPHSRPLVRGKLVDLLLVVGAAILVLATVAATALDKLIQHALRRIESATGLESPLIGAVLPRVAALAASIVVVMLLYRLVPSRRMHRGDALAGAVTTSILLLGISLASSRIYSSATHLSVVYGSLTAAFVFLYSVYLYACALLFGAQVAAAWSLPATPGGEPLRVQLRRTLKGFVTTSEGPDNRR
jgi:uncharacterized BrkB/YihY/UPF0761 family membrane protein